jgi:F-type H+-transporting ATPase subunit alpha
MDEDTRKTLERGRRVRGILKQPQYEPLSVAEQIAVLLAVNKGVLDDIALESVGEAEKKIRRAVKTDLSELCGKIEAGETLEDEDIEAVRKTAETSIKEMRQNAS